MTTIKGLLFNKNGLTIMTLAKVLMKYNVGDKIPTVSELEEKVDVARGTIQNSLKAIEVSGGLVLRAHGALGSYVVKKDLSILMNLANISNLIGVMPLPYSKRYEGLATGLIASAENGCQLPINLAYMNGAKKRIELVLNGRYDFTITSKYAAKEAILLGEPIIIVKDFGPKSYLSSHQIVFSNIKDKTIEEGMRIGIDEGSIDQENITKQVCHGKNVEYVKLAYNQIIDKLLKKEIDAAVWNEDELRIKIENLNAVEVEGFKYQEDTAAVLVVSKDREELAYLINEIIEVSSVLEKQKDVMLNKIIPKY